MRKELVIWIFIFCLSMGNFSPAGGQTDNLADRMNAARMDTVQVADTNAVADPASADLLASEKVAHIWQEIDNDNKGAVRPSEAQRINPWSFSTNVGTSYIFFPRIGSAMNMYAAPQMNFSATERLAFHTGVMVGRTIPVTGIVNQESPVNRGMTNISTYVAASYRLTENLVVHGSGTRSVLLAPVNGELQSMNFDDLSIGATYNFGNFSIGATIHSSDAPFYNTPFGTGSMYGAPLFW